MPRCAQVFVFVNKPAAWKAVALPLSYTRAALKIGGFCYTQKSPVATSVAAERAGGSPDRQAVRHLRATLTPAIIEKPTTWGVRHAFARAAGLPDALDELKPVASAAPLMPWPADVASLMRTTPPRVEGDTK